MVGLLIYYTYYKPILELLKNQSKYIILYYSLKLNFESTRDARQRGWGNLRYQPIYLKVILCNLYLKMDNNTVGEWAHNLIRKTST